MDEKIINIKKGKKKPRHKVNWIQIRTEYETNPVTFLELSKKYNISHDRIRHVAMEEKWTRYRSEVQEQMRKDIKERAINSSLVNADYILSELKKIAEDEEVSTNNKIKALELLGKSIGIFKDTVNINKQGEIKKLEDIICENNL